MSIIKLTQYLHRPNTTELGQGNTHETYMLIESNIDLSNIFPPATDVIVTDSLTKKQYTIKSSKGREFRVNQMGSIYRDYDVRPGDEIIITKIETINDSYINLTVKKYNRVAIIVSGKGAEICNINRLPELSEKGHFTTNIYNRGNVNSLSISFKNSIRKRNDSPKVTDFYKVLLNGNVLATGTYYLTLDENSTLSMLPKSNYNEVEFESNMITDIKNLPTKTLIVKEYIYRQYITAIKSKPFLLLAGISGTGKSRIVRELARACWDKDSKEYDVQKPINYEMIQVKPNWHDSSELIGYISRISGQPIFIAGEFLKFIVKAWEHPEVPYFLCLDEMNLAPVEQYFAEYLSVIETREKNKDGKIVTDALIKPEYKNEKDEKTNELKPAQWYENLVDTLLVGCSDTNIWALRKQFLTEGISIPQNLIVVGTVNMDETTFSFSRKVLDRAMTIEMNEVHLSSGLTEQHEQIDKLEYEELIGTAVKGVDVYEDNKDVCDKALTYLQAVNNVLNGTSFKIAYRTRNDFLLYVVNNLPYNKDEQGNDLSEDFVIARALDEITSMKILSRIEGDDTKVTDSFLDNLKTTIEEGLKSVYEDFKTEDSVSLLKLKEMKQKLVSGYTSFWS